MSALLLVPLLVSCGGPELPLELPPARGNDGMLTASVRIGGSSPTMFVADEVVASLSPSMRGRELVIYARSYDLDETLAFVIDLNTVTLPGVVDLSAHGVLYLEPGVGVGGGDLLFDGLPQGILELEGTPAPGSSVSGRFAFSVPGYDPVRPHDEFMAAIDGTFVLQVLAPQVGY